MAISFNKNEVLKQGVCIKEDDIIFNHISKKDPLMDGWVPWQGAQEKIIILHLGGVIVCFIASMGAFA